MKSIVNQKELADILGVSSPTVATRVEREGLPVLRKGSSGKPSEFDLKEVVPWLIAQEQASVSTNEESPKAISTRKLKAEADLAEIKLAKEAGAVVLIEDALELTAEAIATLRSQLLQLPSRLTPIVLGLTDETLMKESIGKEVNTILTELNAHFSAKAETLKAESSNLNP